jgi:hypothetical protein
MKEKVKGFFLGEKGVLFLIFLFVFLNWLVLIHIEKLTHPDFYHYHSASEKLFAGNLKLEFIPPLFPFLLGLFGRVLGLFTTHTDNFILGGRIISLLSGLGVVFFSFKLLARFVRKYAFIGTIILVISPFFLKLLSIPQTDMLYLFFVAAAFYFFSNEKLRVPFLWAIIGGLLTRFEGILLVGSAYVNYFKVKRKRWLYFTIPLIPLTVCLFFLFLKFAPRIIDKLEFVFTKGHYLYYFKHPAELAHLFYGNFLFFISPEFPGFFKWFLLFVLIVCFFAGVYYLFKIKWQFALSLLSYELIFLFFKGYAAAIDPEVEFRRMFSVIWIFYLATFIGIYYLFKETNKFEKVSVSYRTALLIFFIISVLFLPVIKGTWLLIFLVLVPALIYSVTRFKLKKLELTILLVIFTIFSAQFYYDAGKRTFLYVKNNTNKAGFVIAKWLNNKTVEGDVLVYSYLPMVHYYLDKPGKVKIQNFLFLDEKIYNNRDKLMLALLKKAEKTRIKYIIFDGFLNPEEGFFRVAIHNMLYEEKEILHRKTAKANDSYFRLVKTFLYKGEPVAWVLKPLYDKLPKKKPKPASTNLKH